MATNSIQMQHSSKEPAGFSHDGFSAESDENGFISIPSQFAGEAKAHGFIVVTEKPAPRPLAKDAGGAKGDKKPVKPETEDAGGAKGGDGK